MKTARTPMTYPFASRRQIIQRLGRDPEFARACLTILHRRFVDRDILPRPSGWMASDVKLAEEMYMRVSRAEASSGDLALAAKLAQRYARQLARHFRDDELARNPALKPLAAVYGIAPSVEDEEIDDGPDEDPPPDESALPEDEPAPVAATPLSPTEETVPLPKRRGRPKGSKNRKPGSVAQPGRRKRSR